MYQHTISDVIMLSGIGIHSGTKVNMRLLPADTDMGIIFKRVDFTPAKEIKITPFNITEAIMCTLLASPDDKNVSISTIEHLMSTLCIFRVDNIIVEIDAPELPVMDGSSIEFVKALKKVGVKAQSKARKSIKVLKPVRVQEADKFAEVLPTESTHYRFEIQWDHPVIANTPCVVEFSGEQQDYIERISRARTFGFVDQLEYLHTNNLAKGASLDNAVGITKDGIANPEGLRYPDEFVKHKLLDAIGDFYVGGHIIGYFNCYKSSHALNNKLLRVLLTDKSAWRIVA
ncbi:UDP-3-O-acyl-N-acetylglucosamine deacetylase [Fastidiosibacter lacustris]|uniref:UDP-3-O-acyl-N-acetylglucosamine deacetylase n=1 Tax=Fastidiosibacter lacustris TaxID=2056695 RepID=UPI000E34F5B3|nr:UDP-3-O-acyl-N-acetylglucosamine deacetylase [Fastidiosibacter lacustris]